MDDSSAPLRVDGYYTQPYNELVHPESVWRVSKYFLRRWGPYLTPSRFWAVVAARQFAYWNNKCRWFTVYDRRFAQEACLSTIHFRRLKVEMEQTDTPLALFLRQEPLVEKSRYHVVNGQTKPKPTRYTVRLDEPLTPADAQHLATWLQMQTPQARAESLAATLREARDRPRKELLAPRLTPYLTDKTAVFQAVTVQDVVARVYGAKMVTNSQVQAEADALHSYLTGPDYYGKEYFRVKWLNILKPGPAFLLTYLRSFCFFNEQTGELRNEVSLTRPELADNLGVTTKTIVNWLDKIEKSVPAQAINAFVTLLAQDRLSTNDVRYTYRMEMLEPLTKTDLRQYTQRLHTLPVGAASPPDGKNEDHDMTPATAAEGKNEHHESAPHGKNEDHAALANGAGDRKNEGHDAGLTEKMRSAAGNKEDGSEKKRWPFKYYQSLWQSLTPAEPNPWLAAADWSEAWKLSNEAALLSFAAAACDQDLDRLFDLMQVDRGGPTRFRMTAGGLDMEAMVAWYLYAARQKGLSRPPIHMTIARVQKGQQPPEDCLQMAQLSWELWRCYATLLLLHPAKRDAFRQAPAYDVWMHQYGRCHPDDLPFGVGAGIQVFIDTVMEQPGSKDRPPDIQYGVGGQTPEPGKSWHDSLWVPVMREIQGVMTRATFNTWIKDTVLVDVMEDRANQGETWVVQVENRYAQEWLINRLNNTVIEPMATAVHAKPIQITYVVNEPFA